MAKKISRNNAYYVNRYLSGLDLRGKVVVDVPAGQGTTSALLMERGAEVKALDLFPDAFSVEGAECVYADLGGTLPLESGSADLIICQEGIEHLADQLQALRELNRVLKPGGKLLLTTPSISHLRARLSHFLNESDLYSRLPPTEADSIWFSSGGEDIYFGHIFLMGVQQLRVLGRIAGLKIERLLPTRPSWGSVMLGFLYPLLVLTNLYGYWNSLRRGRGRNEEWKRDVYRDVLKLNLHPRILFGKYMIVELVKERDPEQVAAQFHGLARGEWSYSAKEKWIRPNPQPQPSPAESAAV